MRTLEDRLYPTAIQRQQLMTCLMESRAMYNEMLAALKAQYEVGGTFPSKYDLTARFKGRGGDTLPATTVQTLAVRLSKTLKRYLQRKDLGHPSARALHKPEVQPMWRVRPKEPLDTDASLSLLWPGRRSRRACRQEHRTGGGTAFRDGNRWAAG